MFSLIFGFISPYIKIIKIAAIVSICGLIWYGVHTVNRWHDDSKQLLRITLQLTSELDCTIPSKCASRAMEEAEKSIQAVHDAQAKAEEDNKQRQAENDANEKIASQHNADKVKQLQDKLDKATLSLVKQAAGNNACNVWLHSVIPCDLSEQ